MDIHKPGLNWSEFLKEVGVIVPDVSIALAAEQTNANRSPNPIK